MLVDVAPHELDAMYEVVLYVRAISKALGDAENPEFAAKLQNYAQMVEDVADRVERTPPPRPEPSVPFCKG